MKVKKPFFVLLAILLGLLVAFITKRFFSLFLSSIFLAYMIKPLYSIIKTILKSKGLSAFLAEFIFFTGIVLVIVFVVNSLLSQIVLLSSPWLAENIISLENESLMKFNISYIDWDNPLTQETFIRAGENVKNVVMQTPIILLDLFIITYVSYYFLTSSESVKKNLILMMPEDSKSDIKSFMKKTEMLMKEIIYGYFLTAFFITLLTFIVLSMLGVKYSVDYAIFNGLASLIPVIGNWIIPSSLAMYYLMQGRELTAFVLVTLAFLTSYLIKMFRPIISRSRFRMHPVLLITGVIFGFYTLGLFGLFIGPVLFGILQISLEEVIQE